MEEEEPEQAFIDLLERHQGIVHRVAGLYAQADEDRRDLVQEIVFQLWRSWPRFRHESSATTWMYRIAVNTALTRLRRGRGDLVTVPLEENHPAPAIHPDRGDGGMLARTLHAAIRTLDAADRAVVMLQLEGFSHREIGDMLGITENLVSVKLHRIRGRLRALLKD